MTAAAANARPDLFGVAVAKVPVADMLRYSKFTVSQIWINEYLHADKSGDVHGILNYSPLHNVKKVKYPLMVLSTAENDDRVSPLHAFKLTAEL